MFFSYKVCENFILKIFPIFFFTDHLTLKINIVNGNYLLLFFFTWILIAKLSIYCVDFSEEKLKFRKKVLNLIEFLWKIWITFEKKKIYIKMHNTYFLALKYLITICCLYIALKNPKLLFFTYLYSFFV